MNFYFLAIAGLLAPLKPSHAKGAARLRGLQEIDMPMSMPGIETPMSTGGIECNEAPECSSGFGKVVHKVKQDGSCEETCAYLLPLKWLVLGYKCGECTVDCPATESTRLFNQDIVPNVTFGSGNANGFFTSVRTDTLEVGIRAKVRYPTPMNPDSSISNNDGTYSFDAGEFDTTVPCTMCPLAQQWSFDWSINTDRTAPGDGTMAAQAFPIDYTYEIGLDVDPSPGTCFTRFDPISPTLPIPNPHFDLNTGSGDSGITCGTNAATYEACMRGMNVIQDSQAYNFFTPFMLLPGFDPTEGDANYVIYLRVIGEDPDCGERYVVAETYMEVLVGHGNKLESPPQLPEDLVEPGFGNIIVANCGGT